MTVHTVAVAVFALALSVTFVGCGPSTTLSGRHIKYRKYADVRTVEGLWPESWDGQRPTMPGLPKARVLQANEKGAPAVLLLAENIVSHRIDIKVSFDSSSPAPDERDEGREEWSVHSIAPYSTTNIARSILIVTEAGRTFASIQLRIPERTVLKFFQARTILADGTIIPAKLPESALRPGEDGSRTLALALPNAKPGSIVQYIYQLEEAGFSRAARLTLPAALPVRRARLTLRSYDFIKVKKQADDVFDLRPAIASEGQRKFSWQASDVSAKKAPLRASWHVTRIDTSSRNTNASGD